MTKPRTYTDGGNFVFAPATAIHHAVPSSRIGRGVPAIDAGIVTRQRSRPVSGSHCTKVRPRSSNRIAYQGASGAVCTIVADDGSFESPPLSRAEGWHYTFDKPGSHAFHLKELAKSAGKIVVGPRPTH